MTNQIPWKINKDVIVREESETNPDYGTPPYQRPISQHIRFGLINLDKPRNPSSQEVTSWVKKLLGVKHAGHGGTLEVFNTGKIPWCLAYYL